MVSEMQTPDRAPGRAPKLKVKPSGQLLVDF